MLFLTRSYATGLLFIVLVAIIWAASSILVQFLYTSDDFSFDSPFLVTYIGVSLFTLWLPTNAILQVIFKARDDNGPSLFEAVVELVVPYWGGREGVAEYRSLTSVEAIRMDTINEDDEEEQDPPQPTEHDLPVTSTSNDTTSPDVNDDSHQYHWTHADHRAAALRIAPVWFLANWTYNASLAYTSITSSTVLASTGSLFTFLFAVCGQDENFSSLKLAGVLLGVAGSTVTAWHDHDDDSDATSSPSTSSNHALWGDTLGLVSAVGYGAYAVQTRLLCPHKEELYSMQVLLGYIGLFNMIALSPMAIYLLCFSHDSGLTGVVLSVLIVKGLFDNVISDWMWLRAVMLTSATVATVGLGLTIPLALVSDIWLYPDTTGHSVLTLGSVGGAVLVMTGFVLVNAGNDNTDEENGHHEFRHVIETVTDDRDDDDSATVGTFRDDDELPQ